MEATLGYWNIRGLGHSIRLLLEYTKTPYKEKQYVLGGKGGSVYSNLHYSQNDDCAIITITGLIICIPTSDAMENNENTPKQVGMLGIVPTMDMTEWTSVKEKLGLDFPNLPYLIDGDRKISQSNAILRYIARKHKMCGETEEEMIRMDMLESHLMDFRMGFAKLCYSPDFEKLKPDYLELLPGKLKQFSQFLGDRKWFAEKKLTYIDFIAYDALDVHQMLDPKCLDQFPNLKEFLHRFEALERIAPYLKSSRCIRSPIFWSCATWNGNKI